jgi:hypothetical protein
MKPLQPFRLRRVLVAVLLVVGITACQPSHPPREPLRFDVPPPVSWTGLQTGIDGQTAWYRAVVDRAAWFEWAAHLPRPHAARRSSRYGSAVECIAGTENNGDYGRSSNPNHFGRYQYDRPTWEANGGNPDTWGSASPAEQDRVFAATIARYGTGPWRGDGCV